MAPIRLADVADARALAHLLHAFNREFDASTPGPDVLTDRLRGLLARDDVFAVLADTAAFALVTLRPNVWHDGPVALLDELYVTPDRRNHGLGSALLAEVQAEVRRRGGEVVEIEVDGEDVDARRFYERHGYADREPGHTESTVRYFRDLA